MEENKLLRGVHFLKTSYCKIPGKYALFNLQFPNRSVKLMLICFITCGLSSLRFAYNSREAATRVPLGDTDAMAARILEILENPWSVSGK
ncbi:MAG: hypothetical protein LM575_07900 [Caldimicrobium sp.]|nr:hypothetical protein [Caldimicrobium sp.]